MAHVEPRAGLDGDAGKGGGEGNFVARQNGQSKLGPGSSPSKIPGWRFAAFHSSQANQKPSIAGWLHGNLPIEDWEVGKLLQIWVYYTHARFSGCLGVDMRMSPRA